MTVSPRTALLYYTIRYLNIVHYCVRESITPLGITFTCCTVLHYTCMTATPVLYSAVLRTALHCTVLWWTVRARPSHLVVNGTRSVRCGSSYNTTICNVEIHCDVHYCIDTMHDVSYHSQTHYTTVHTATSTLVSFSVYLTVLSVHASVDPCIMSSVQSYTYCTSVRSSIATLSVLRHSPTIRFPLPPATLIDTNSSQSVAYCKYNTAHVAHPRNNDIHRTSRRHNAHRSAWMCCYFSGGITALVNSVTVLYHTATYVVDLQQLDCTKMQNLAQNCAKAQWCSTRKLQNGVECKVLCCTVL
jgi:hypothetical protein